MLHNYNMVPLWEAFLLLLTRKHHRRPPCPYNLGASLLKSSLPEHISERHDDDGSFSDLTDRALLLPCLAAWQDSDLKVQQIGV